ncbi:MAG: toll/interleukin-1 receptor domain-containing protein [Defluviicoccus sp.]|nr:MAG: toll/interleukin-1 receptor domain-containing protein [Defluviicoccus sp.]
MAHIFLSYAREDIETARWLDAALRARGWEVWWDTG